MGGATGASSSENQTSAPADAHQASNQPQEKKNPIEEWFMDLGEGFKEIYLAVFDKREKCANCVEGTVYPVKEGLVNCVDDIKKKMNPGQEERSARGDFQNAAHFVYD